jgi:hypothetical protein
MPQSTTSAHRPRLAAVITAYKRLLHGQHVVDRFLDGYGWAGTFHHPAMDVVSLYVDQRGEGDLTETPQLAVSYQPPAESQIRSQLKGSASLGFRLLRALRDRKY